MNSEPVVTIVTSCYNHEKYLDDYFEGLLSQTYRNIELILFDDGSTDGSWDKILTYESRLRAKFPFVTCERHENMGGAKETIIALKQARGDLLCLLDSDDYYLPTKIEENVRFLLEHPEAGGVHSDLDFIVKGRLEYRHNSTTGTQIVSGEIFEALLIDNFIMTCTFCCRTELFRKYVDIAQYVARGYIANDYAIFLDLAHHSTIGYIGKSLARYRVLRNSLVHTTDPERIFELARNYQQIKLDYIEKYDGSERARTLAVEGIHEALFLFMFRMHRVEPCLETYQWLVNHNPRRYRALPYRTLALSIRNKFSWRMMRWLESHQTARTTVLDLFSLKNRGRVVAR